MNQMYEYSSLWWNQYKVHLSSANLQIEIFFHDTEWEIYELLCIVCFMFLWRYFALNAPQNQHTSHLNVYKALFKTISICMNFKECKFSPLRSGFRPKKLNVDETILLWDHKYQFQTIEREVFHRFFWQIYSPILYQDLQECLLMKWVCWFRMMNEECLFEWTVFNKNWWFLH